LSLLVVCPEFSHAGAEVGRRTRSLNHALGGEFRRCGMDQPPPDGCAGWQWCAWCGLALWWKSEANINQRLVNINRWLIFGFFYECILGGG